MGAIEQTIADAVRAGITEAVKPLQDDIAWLRKIIESKNEPADERVKQKDLPAKLGDVGLTKLRKTLGLNGAPKPDALGLYSVKACRTFIDNLPSDSASKKAEN
ncbi:hypothetical protein DTO96_102437 [Ephemeroptericola cinctiostellae]|uniref:Uncharacterized protein n=1 Tax=Ephemeroptericola cinctiostellae TaxID=2268024 RepID=A0A345DE94_9BURK|nr:hypothetical protein [Ephemeroptericola cinctiostellae]AXF86682.1 hypothetical protein DTO96_102437 [Ephemeroptericola cinctiostellae]